MPKCAALLPGLVAIAAAALVSACANADITSTDVAPCAAAPATGVSASQSGNLSIWSVLPRSTDICISQQLDSHFVYRAPTVSATGRLFLFLPASGALPRESRLILAQAALAGYHSIGLTYPSEDNLSALCAGTASTCFGDARREILTGRPVSAAVNIDRANSIENRLVRVLQLMTTVEPGGDWGQFLNSDAAPAWQKISIAGHTQGGSFALFVAQQYSVYRATTYASYGDELTGSTGRLAPWLTQPYATPLSRVFGLISSFDEIVSPSTALSSWTAIGLGPQLVDVDVTAPPYGSAQRFITAAAPLNGRTTLNPNHKVLTVDLNTPTRGGVPILAGVWRALSFPNP